MTEEMYRKIKIYQENGSKLLVGDALTDEEASIEGELRGKNVGLMLLEYCDRMRKQLEIAKISLEHVRRTHGSHSASSALHDIASLEATL